MMKRKMNKTYFKIGLLLLTAYLFLYNCQKEDFFIKTTETVQRPVKDYHIDWLTSKELQQDINIASVLPKINARVKNNIHTNTHDRNVVVGDGLVIFDDQIARIEVESTISWTFKIETPTDESSNFENFMVKKHGDTFSYFLVKYIENSEDDQQPYTVTIQRLDGDTLDISELDLSSRTDQLTNGDNGGGGTSECEAIITHLPCDAGGSNQHGPVCQHAGSPHPYGCHHMCSGTTMVVDFTHCFTDGDISGGQGDSNTNNTDPNNNNPGGGPGGNPNSNNEDDIDPNVTTPINPDGTSEEAEALIQILEITDQCQLAWLEDEENTVVVSAAFSFGTEHYWTEETITFLKEVVRANCGGDIEVDWEEKILLDSTFVNHPRLKCVYDKFKEGDNTISNYLENFTGETPVANLEFKADDKFKDTQDPVYHSAGALTNEPSNYLINITFNTDPRLPSSAGNFPTIILAVELVHEMIHAEIFRKLLDHAQTPNIPWTRTFIESLANDFGGLADYYTRYWLELPPGQAPNQEQHQLMASHYRDMMVQALKDFDNNQHSQEFYEALAWIGLKGSGAVDPNTQLPLNATEAWKNLTVTERNNINNLINNAMNNETHECN